ncbi:MAG: ABC transporter ATP-binding protein [Holosporales bacterium]|nr:ABC transporter ATP-binding protein [Holosporales bacterium]
MQTNVGISVEIRNLKKSFNKGKIKALNGITLNFTEGMLHGIIGPAGAGKTTLLRIILTLMEKDEGNIQYYSDGQAINFKTIMPNAAYMPEQQSLYADLSIEEHLKFFASMYGLDHNTYIERTQNLLTMTKLEKFLNRPAGKLSGGMYKKLGLMCALLRSPKIMFLDEPTNGVDPISRREFWDILNNATKNNITILMTTAYMDEAERCEQVHLLEDGYVLGSGEPRELLSSESVENFDEFFIKRAAYQVRHKVYE